MLGTWLERANLRGARLMAGSFIRARFRGASLISANLDQATLTQASFVNADLAGASLRFARLNGTDFSGANIDGAAFANAEAGEALNLDAARNAAAAIWEDRAAPAAKLAPTAKRTITARIIPRNGDPVDVETLEDRTEVFFYTRDGATYGMPKANIRRIEDGQGRVLREFVDKIGPLRLGADCTRPIIGDSDTYVGNYLRCMEKHKVRAILSQGVSTKTAAESSGRVAEPAATGARLQRWELRDEQGRLLEVYEALGGSVTLASE
jgi:hypothetical protein